MLNGTSPLNPGVDVSKEASPIFFGGLVSLILMGVTVVQFWTYLTENRDSLRLRFFVFTIVILDAACTCLLVAHLTSRLITHFGSDPSLIFLPTKSIGVELLLNIIIIIAVDFFLANQIRNLGQAHWSVAVFIIVTSTIAFAIVFLQTIMTLTSPSLAITLSYATKLGMALITSGNVLFTISEVVAGAALAWSLHRSKTGIRRTDGILNKLCTWMVTRGILLSVIQVCSMALYLAKPFSFDWEPFHLLQSKLYVITTLSLLNSRKSLRRQINLFNSTFTEYSGEYTATSGHPSSRGNGRNPINVSYPLASNERSSQSRIREDDLESSLAPESPLKSKNPSFSQDGFAMRRSKETVRPGPQVLISREEITTTD